MDDATKRSLDYLEAREQDRQSSFADDVKYSALFVGIGAALLVCVGWFIWLIVA